MAETVEILTQVINNVGFPIAAFCMMFWQNIKLRETLDANTKALYDLADKVNDIEDKLSN